MSRNTDSVVSRPSRRTDGRKIDTWEVRIPNGKKVFGWREGVQTVDIYMMRDDDSTYVFYLEIPREAGKFGTSKLMAKTPTELKDMLNLAVTAYIERDWDKGLLVKMGYTRNNMAGAEDPGEHELQLEWHVVYSQKCGKYTLYVEEGDLFQRDLDSSSKIIPWSQHREDVLRALGKAIHEASVRLQELLHEGGLQSMLDRSTPPQRLLEGSLGDKKA